MVDVVMQWHMFSFLSKYYYSNWFRISSQFCFKTLTVTYYGILTLQHAYRDGCLEEVALRHLGAEDGNTVIAKNIRFEGRLILTLCFITCHPF